MIYKPHAPRSGFPRLVIERSETAPEDLVGYLQVSEGERIGLGDVEGREFRLIQCLFSPKNFMSAKYEPVAQTHERLFGAIRSKKDALNARLSSPQSAGSEITGIVERSLRLLQKGAAGKHFSFVSHDGKAMMSKVL